MFFLTWVEGLRAEICLCLFVINLTFICLYLHLHAQNKMINQIFILLLAKLYQHKAKKK